MLSSRLSARLIQPQRLLVVLYAASLPISLSASWVILSIGLAVWLLEIVAACLQSRSMVLDLAKPPLLLPLSLFGAAVFASGLVAGGIVQAFDSLVSLRALLVYFWAEEIFSRDRALMLMSIQALLVVGAAGGVFGMIQQLLNFHPFGYQYLQGTGFLGGPMAYAGQMQIFAMLSLGIFLTGGFRDFRLGLSRPAVFALITLANITGVLFASERSAWLGAIAGAMALTAVLSWRTLLKCCLALAVISALCWATVPVVHTRIAALENWQQDISVRVRLQIWRESVRIWMNAPLFGVGIRHYPHFNIPEATVLGRSKELNHAHSNYLHIASTSGIFGLGTYLWLWFAVLRTALIACRQTGQDAEWRGERAVALGIFGGTVALIVSGIFEYNFGTAQVRLAQWFVLAMLPASRRR